MRRLPCGEFKVMSYQSTHDIGEETKHRKVNEMKDAERTILKQ